MTRNEFLKRLLLGGGFGGCGGWFGGPGATTTYGATTDLPSFPFPFPQGYLERWKQRPLVPLREPGDPDLAHLVDLAERQESIRIVYHRGRSPGTGREIHPLLVFARPTCQQLEEWMLTRPWIDEERSPGEDVRDVSGKGNGNGNGRFHDPVDRADESELWRSLARFLEKRCSIYVLAWCRLREQQRCFHVDWMDWE